MRTSQNSLFYSSFFKYKYIKVSRLIGTISLSEIKGNMPCAMLWYLMPLSTIFQLYHGGGNRSTQRQPPTCRKSLANFYHIMLYRVHLVMNGVQTYNFGDRHWLHTGSCKSNYHTIEAPIPPSTPNKRDYHTWIKRHTSSVKTVSAFNIISVASWQTALFSKGET